MINNLSTYIQFKKMKILIYVLCVMITLGAKLESGELELQVKSGGSADKYRVNVNSQIQTKLKLTQSSVIEIEGSLKFNEANFIPDLITIRLIHPEYKMLTQPVQAEYDEVENRVKVIVDLGDPRVIQPYTGEYELELIVSDEELENSIRRKIANTKINFRYSMDAPPTTYLSYHPQPIIESAPPSVRVDPPQTFTSFVVVISVLLFTVFLYGLVHLKANVNLLFTSTSALVLNLMLIGLLGVNLLFLVKFWLGWTFISTVKYFLLLIIPTALVGNYALLSLKK